MRYAALASELADEWKEENALSDANAQMLAALRSVAESTPYRYYLGETNKNPRGEGTVVYTVHDGLRLECLPNSKHRVPEKGDLVKYWWDNGTLYNAQVTETTTTKTGITCLLEWGAENWNKDYGTATLFTKKRVSFPVRRMERLDPASKALTERERRLLTTTDTIGALYTINASVHTHQEDSQEFRGDVYAAWKGRPFQWIEAHAVLTNGARDADVVQRCSDVDKKTRQSLVNLVPEAVEEEGEDTEWLDDDDVQGLFFRHNQRLSWSGLCRALHESTTPDAATLRNARSDLQQEVSCTVYTSGGGGEVLALQEETTTTDRFPKRHKTWKSRVATLVCPPPTKPDVVADLLHYQVLQPVEMLTWGSFVGSRVHNKLVFNAVRKAEPDYYQAAFPNKLSNERQSATLRAFTTCFQKDALALYGSIDDVLCENIERAFGARGWKVLAHELPVVDLNRHYGTGKRLRFFESRLDFVARSADGKLVLGDYKCKVGETTQHNVVQWKDFWQVLCNAWFLLVHYHLLVDVVAVVYANRRQQVFVCELPFTCSKERLTSATKRGQKPTREDSYPELFLNAFLRGVPSTYFDQDLIVTRAEARLGPFLKGTLWEFTRVARYHEFLRTGNENALKRHPAQFELALKKAIPTTGKKETRWEVTDCPTGNDLPRYRSRREKCEWEFFTYTSPATGSIRDAADLIHARLRRDLVFPPVYFAAQATKRVTNPTFRSPSEKQRLIHFEDSERKAARLHLNSKVVACVREWTLHSELGPEIKRRSPAQLQHAVEGVCGSLRRQRNDTPAPMPLSTATSTLDARTLTLVRALHRRINRDLHARLEFTPPPPPPAAPNPFHLYKDDLLDFVHVSQRCFWDGNELRKASIKSKGSAFLVVEAALRANFGLPGCPK